MAGATSSNDATRSETSGVAGMGRVVRRQWTPTPYHSPQPPSLLAFWAMLLIGVLAVLLAFAHEATSADPAPVIVGKALEPAYPPSWLAPLEDIRMPISALPYDTYPLPQQNTQRSPIRQLARFTALSGHGVIVDPYRKAVWYPINGGRNLDVQVNYVKGGLLFGEQIPESCRGLLVLQRYALDGSPTDVTRINPDVRAAVAKQWRDPTTPVINVIPVGADGYCQSIISGVKTTPQVIPEALTVCGWSWSTAPYQVHCANAAVAFRVKTYDAYKAQGKLCDAICESVYAGVLKATGRKKYGDLFPAIEDCTAAQHISIAAYAAEHANAMLPDGEQPADPFEVWASKVTLPTDPKAAARLGWEAAKTILAP